MKILMVHNAYQQPGGEDVAFEQECRALLSHRHKVITYCRSNAEIAEINLLKRVATLGNVISSAQAKEDIRKLLSKEKPEIVHVHNTFAMITPSVYEACNEKGIPVIQSIHNYRLLCPAATLFRAGRICTECEEVSLWRSIQHGCYRHSRSTTAMVALMLNVHRARRTWSSRVTAYVVPSEFLRRKLAAAIPADRIVVKPNFVGLDPGVRSSTGSHALFVGRLTQEKGVLTLLRAWEKLEIDLPLLIAGDGPLRTQMEAEISRKGLRSIRLLGWSDRRAVQEAMKGAKFVIFPSEWYEPFGQTIVEAFACGTAVIGSRLAAAEEIISDGRTGLHFVPGQADDLARKVDWASRHPHEIAEMGTAARREYEMKYTADINYAQLMAIYNRVLEVGHATNERMASD